MKPTLLERRAQKLHLATGIPWAQALKRSRELVPSAPLIPNAQPSQAVLESCLLNGIAWPQSDPRNPWGIRFLEPRPDSLIVTFEEQQRGAHDGSLTQDLIQAVIPRFDEYGEVHGIPGARVTVHGEGVLIRRIGKPGSVIIRGVSAEDWTAALAVQQEANDKHGMTYCHDLSPHEWHRTELPYREPREDTTSGRHHRKMVTSAWLASGLLRRAPLLRTIGVPLSTTAWTNPARNGGCSWIIEYIHEPRVQEPLHHHGFINLLTDPECGLPITTTALRCHCHWLPESYSVCWFDARGVNGRLGTLQVRFSRRSGDKLEDYADEPEDYHARRKLYRQIPSHLMWRSTTRTAGTSRGGGCPADAYNRRHASS
ncbi:hypothetical protein [Streptomyces sp. Da 82-17]|uniref:hypothetical protein n=1 Tax=Streptomyces sp. Da 82-17 TaxID=3377116 RepID=UPI0038D3B16B